MLHMKILDNGPAWSSIWFDKPAERDAAPRVARVHTTADAGDTTDGNNVVLADIDFYARPIATKGNAASKWTSALPAMFGPFSKPSNN